MEKNLPTTRITIALNEDLVNKIDEMAKSIGCSRSSLCAVWLGQTVYGYDKLFEQTNNAIRELAISKNDK